MVTSIESTSAHPPQAAAPRTLASWFGATAERCGDRVAVRAGNAEMTYAELLHRADYTAAVLHGFGVGPGAVVAIFMDRSIEMLIAMLGVVRAGAAYLPIDPNYPTARVRETLRDARPAGVIADRTRAASLSGATPRVLIADDLPTMPAPRHGAPVRALTPDDPAYIIYTSGSTGSPKGVRITQRNVVRLFEQTERWFGFDQNDVWTMFHSFAFDFSVWEIWGALLYGGRLVIVPFATSRSPEDFYQLLAQEQVTVLNQTPTAFSLLMAVDAAAHESRVPLELSLRTVIFGGEALNLRALTGWFERHGDTQPELINMYGITETTVHVTYRRLRAEEAARETDSLIGEPIPDLRIDLLDASLQPVPEGEPGEIVIGGPGVANGYLNRPELTHERFVADPLSSNGARLYRSGDLARRRADGELVYLGRADRQVKINGFRIELGEIEGVLAAVPGVRQVCAVPHGAPGEQRLVLYFAADPEIAPDRLSRHAETNLPPQMRPSFYLRLERLPLDNNGKVDRKALPEPTQTTPSTPMPAPAAAPAATGSPEARITAIWQALLGTAAFGSDTNFFDVGGSSLLVIRLRAELERAFAVKIPVTALFEHTTVRALGTMIARLSAPASSSAAPAGSAAASRAEQQRAAMARLRAVREVAR